MTQATASKLGEADDLKKFHFTREMMRGDVYRKYEKAINAIWNPRELDYSRDVEDWARIPTERAEALLGLTVRFFAGEQAVAENLVPMLEAAWALERFDWLMYLSTFVMEECKHAEFFAQWHERVPGILEPDELAPYFIQREKTVDPTGRFELKEVVHEGLPRYAREVTAAVQAGDREQIERAFLRFLTLYNATRRGRSHDAVVRDRRRYVYGLGRAPGPQAGLPADHVRRGQAHHIRHLCGQGDPG